MQSSGPRQLAHSLIEAQGDIKDELSDWRTDKTVSADEAKHLDERLNQIEKG